MTQTLDSGADGFFDAVAETASMIREGRAQDAADRCARLLRAGRGSALTRAAYGRALVALKRIPEALEVLREASQLSPNTAEVLLAFGEALAAAGSLPAAIGELQRASRLAPNDDRPHMQIALLWLDAGEADKALSSLEAAVELGASDQCQIDFINARAEQIKTGARADAGYVRHLFDQFAGDYDTRMQERLGYTAPAILRQIAGFLVSPGGNLSVLDLGCGTGLSGVAFRDVASRTTGVDLSPRMLEKAKETGAYHALIEGDVEAPPQTADGPFDLVIAADVLVYLGDLGKLFSGVRQRLTPDGLWLFTSERGDERDYELSSKRRYRHSERYLRELAKLHGFEVASLVECVTRYEAGQGVASWAGAFRASET